MNITKEKYIDRLVDISAQKLELMNEIYKLTVKQSESITEEGVESLGKLIDDKQGVIDRINKLNEEFEVYFERFKSVLGVDSLDQAKGIAGVDRLQSIIGNIMAVINRIRGLEESNNRKAKELLDKFGQEIRKINDGKKVSNAYNPGYSAPPTSYFIDKKK